MSDNIVGVDDVALCAIADVPFCVVDSNVVRVILELELLIDVIAVGAVHTRVSHLQFSGGFAQSC